MPGARENVRALRHEVHTAEDEVDSVGPRGHLRQAIRVAGEIGEAHDFIALVKSRRTGKLTGAEENLFSGEYWTGRRALALGLVDAIGDLRSGLRARFGDKVHMPVIAPDLNAISSPEASPLREACAVRTLARTEMFIPT